MGKIKSRAALKDVNKHLTLSFSSNPLVRHSSAGAFYTRQRPTSWTTLQWLTDQCPVWLGQHNYTVIVATGAGQLTPFHWICLYLRLRITDLLTNIIHYSTKLKFFANVFVFTRRLNYEYFSLHSTVGPYVSLINIVTCLGTKLYYYAFPLNITIVIRYLTFQGVDGTKHTKQICSIHGDIVPLLLMLFCWNYSSCHFKKEAKDDISLLWYWKFNIGQAKCRIMLKL